MNQHGVAMNSTMVLLDKMATTMRQHGIEIYCPWDGDLSDDEMERYEALVAVLDEVEKAIGKSAP